MIVEYPRHCRGAAAGVAALLIALVNVSLLAIKAAMANLRTD